MSESPEPEFTNSEIQRRRLFRVYELFCLTATIQGRLSYFVMSIHAVNPHVIKLFTNYDPKPVLFANMVYGISLLIYSRPSMRTISTFNRASFSILGSLMFNHSTMVFYEWLGKYLENRPSLLTFFGFLGGRVMMIHLLAYLYHVDSRYRGGHLRQHPEYESMYR